MRQLTIDGRQEDIPQRHERMKLFDPPKTIRGQLGFTTPSVKQQFVIDRLQREDRWYMRGKTLWVEVWPSGIVRMYSPKGERVDPR